MNPQFVAGDIMAITDHINLLGDSPLVGRHHSEFGARFVDMTGVYDAPDIVVPVKGLENDEHRVPNQRIAFEVSRSILGKVEGTFDLFHTGNENYVLDGDPPYEMGKRYLLFLTPRDDGTYRVISPEGRYQITPNGLEPVSHEEFSQMLRGTSVRDLTRDLTETLGFQMK